MRHFDVQLIGGMVLHEGKIAEMRTGEGKTLVATLPVYLNALTGKGVHVVTVNDYLARRDADWMGQIYRFLGMTVGVVIAGMSLTRSVSPTAPISPTAPTTNTASIICATTWPSGWSRRCSAAALRVGRRGGLDPDRRGAHAADHLRPGRGKLRTVPRVNAIVPRLTRQKEEDGPGDYWVDEKVKQVYLTEDGHQRVEELLLEAGLLHGGESLYDAANLSVFHHMNACLRAHALFHRDVEYIVRGGEVIIVDEFTGRTMPGRRWSDGLHQAIEAKEGVPIQAENQTLASITFQNYFRLYQKLAGMTGTADTEAFEFQQIYGLGSDRGHSHPSADGAQGHGRFGVPHPAGEVRCGAGRYPRLPQARPADWSAPPPSKCRNCWRRMLDKEKIPHQVLNAKQHEREAEIIAQAGRPGAVTIATNMAGRGTDIVLGGNCKPS
jgi:preprotein translocase subunit SecA